MYGRSTAQQWHMRHFWCIQCIRCAHSGFSKSIPQFIVYTANYINNRFALTFRVYHLWMCLIYEPQPHYCTSFDNWLVSWQCHNFCLQRFFLHVHWTCFEINGFKFSYILVEIIMQFEMSWNNLTIKLYTISDYFELNASIPAKNNACTPIAWPKYSNNTKRIARIRSQNVHFPRNGVHGRHSLSKSVNHKTENRFESICQRFPRFIQTDGIR